MPIDKNLFSITSEDSLESVTEDSKSFLEGYTPKTVEVTPTAAMKAVDSVVVDQELNGKDLNRANLVAANAHNEQFTGVLNDAFRNFSVDKAEKELAVEIGKQIGSRTPNTDAIKEKKEALDATAAANPTSGDAAISLTSSTVDGDLAAKREKKILGLTQEIADLRSRGLNADRQEYSLAFILDPAKAEKGLEAPVYDPIDLAVDVLSFGALSGVKALAKGATSPTVKLLAKETTKDVYYGAMAGGFMSLADMEDSSETVKYVSGLLGPVATSALFTTSRKGLATFMKNMSNSNKDLYGKIMSYAASRDDKFADAIRRTKDWKVVEGSGIEQGTSPLATQAKMGALTEDEGIQKLTSELIRTANIAPEELKKSLEASADGGSFLPVVGVWKNVKPTPVPSDFFTDIAKNAHNANILNMSSGPRVLWDSLTEKQEGVIKDLDIKIISDKFDFGTSSLGWQDAPKNNWFSRVFASPSNVLKGKKAHDLVGNPTYLDQQANRLDKIYLDAFKGTMKGLNSEDKALLGTILDGINQKGEPLNPVKGGFLIGRDFIPCTDKVKDSYYAVRILMDETWRMSNTSAVHQASRQGIVFHEGEGIPVREKKGTEYGSRGTNGIEWTKDLKKKGAKWVENIETKEGYVILPGQLNKLRELRVTDQLLTYEKDYIPIIYKEDWRVLSLKGNEAGGIDVGFVATAPNNKTARATAKRLKAGDDETHFISVRKGDTVVSAAIESGAADSLHNLTPRQLLDVRRGLRKHGISDDALDSVMDNIRTFSYKRTSNLFERGAKRMKNSDLTDIAPMEPADKAIASYLSKTANYVTKAEYNAFLRDEFLTTYGEMLADAHNWTSDIKTINQFNIPFDNKMVKEAKLVQDQIRMSVGLKDKNQLIVEAWQDTLADRLRRKDNVWSRFGAELLDRAPNIYTVAGGLKKVAAVSKLGMFNISQIVVQGTGILNTVGKNAFKPEVLDGTVRDVLSVINPMDKKGKYLRKVYKESGFGSTSNYANLDDIVAGIRGNGGVFGRVVDAGQIAYNAGEGLQRAVAWAAERRTLIASIRNGLHPRFKMKDVDSPEFLKAVSDAANNTALNMGRFNQPRFARGLAGVPFQFMQFATHQSELMMPGLGKLSTKEKVGTWAAWLGAFGASGVPFLYDASLLGETIGEWTGHPEYVGATDRLFDELFGKYKKGLGSGEFFDISNRAGVAHMLQNFYDGVGIEDLTGPGGNILVKMLHGGVNTVQDAYLVITGEKQFTGDMAVQPFKEVSGIYNPYSAIRAAATGEVRSKTGKLIAEEPDLREVIALGLGITPAEFVKSSERRNLNFRINSAWKDWAKNKAESIAEVARANPDFSAKMFEDALRQITEYNPTKVNEFTKRLVWAYQSRMVPEELRDLMNTIRNDYQLPDSLREE